MKERKALKRLNRVETLLGTVIDQYDARSPVVHEFLGAARASVASATQALAATPARKTIAKADHPPSRKLSNAARKRLSLAAKKRWAAAKNKGMTTLARVPSRRIA
jgi:hypothetical protein